MINKKLNQRRIKIKRYVRQKIKGTSGTPRLSVYRSMNQIYGQLIDDINGKTIISLSSLSKEVKEVLKDAKSKVNKSTLVGKLLAEKAISKNVTKVVFDRNGYLYHGRIKAFAEGARDGGLQF